jgi:hypothetical protein
MSGASTTRAVHHGASAAPSSAAVASTSFVGQLMCRNTSCWATFMVPAASSTHATATSTPTAHRGNHPCRRTRNTSATFHVTATVTMATFSGRLRYAVHVTSATACVR